MKTLSVIVVGVLLGVAANGAAVAAEGSEVTTITVTGKRLHTRASTASVPPKAAVVIAAPLLTDMPEMEIDRHLTPVDVGSALR